MHGMKLDRHDRRLLNLVRQDASLSAEPLAERVALSPTAIQRRLTRLREDGVIVRETAVLDPAAVGRPTALMARLVGENPNVRCFTTRVALSVVKHGLTIPVPQYEDA